jgi:hypothetical protein
VDGVEDFSSLVTIGVYTLDPNSTMSRSSGVVRNRELI